MFKRIVLLKSPDAAAVSTLLQELHAFPGQVPGLVAVEVIADSGERSLGFDQGFILTFTDESVLPGWREHPLHAGFRPRLRVVPDVDFRLPAPCARTPEGRPLCLRLNPLLRCWSSAALPGSVLQSPNCSTSKERESPWPGAVRRGCIALRTTSARTWQPRHWTLRNRRSWRIFLPADALEAHCRHRRLADLRPTA